MAIFVWGVTKITVNQSILTQEGFFSTFPINKNGWEEKICTTCTNTTISNLIIITIYNDELNEKIGKKIGLRRVTSALGMQIHSGQGLTNSFFVHVFFCCIKG